MGCGTSAPVNYNKQRYARNQFDFYDEEEVVQQPVEIPLSDILKIDVQKIIQGISQIKAPTQLNPVVCLGAHAFPLYLSRFIYDTQHEENLLLPVICFSHLKKCKFAYFGSINFLSHSLLTSTETSAFIENSITWGADYKVSTIKIFLYDLPKHMVQSVQSDIQGFGYIIDQGNTLPKGNFDIIMTTSQCGNQEQLMEIAQKGTAVFIFFDPPYKKMKIDEISGLSFPPCSLLSIDTTIKNPDWSVLDSYTLANIKNAFFDLLSDENATESKLDAVISKLRYYIDEIRSVESDDIIQIYEKSLAYLEKTDYRRNDMICYTVEQCMVSIVLMEIIQKIPPKLMTPIPSIDLFPGEFSIEHKVKEAVRVPLKVGYWISTCLWLPAGSVGTITSSVEIAVQVGSHAFCTLMKPGPWKRWPTVITTYVVAKDTPTEIGTPFGGPVYLISDKNCMANIEFSGFSRYPFYSYDNPDEWSKTKDIKIDWGEIRSKHCDINLLVKSMPDSEKLPQFCEFIDKIIKLIKQVEGISDALRSRIVFDIDLPSDEPFAYDGVVYVPHENVQEYLDTSKPEKGLYKLMQCIAQSFIAEIFLDEEIELTVSICALKYALATIDPNCVMPDFTKRVDSKLANPISSVIQQYGAEAFGNSIKQLAQSNVDNPDMAWNHFVSFMSGNANADVSKILTISIKPSLLLATSSERLSQYQMDIL